MSRFLSCAVIVVLIGLSLMGCRTKYGEGERVVYYCLRDGKPLIAATPCASDHEDYLLLTDDGGALGSFSVYIDLCDNYTVTIVGDYEVIGSPPFEHQSLSWYEHGQRRDTMKAEYSSAECKHYVRY